MSINEIMNYVRKTPGNTNPAVIKSMVESENSKYIEEAADKTIHKLKESGQIGHVDVVPGFSIKWDGNTEDREYGIMFLAGNPYAYIYKVSDRVFIREELIGATLVNVTGESIVLTESMVLETSMMGVSTGDGAIVASDNGFHIFSSKAVVINKDDIYVKIPSDGTYFVCTSTESYPSELTKEETEIIHPIDQKYLPDNVVDCDALTCTTTDGKETVMSFSEAILQLFAETLFSSGKAKVKKVIDNNGAFKQAVSGKRSITLKQTTLDGVINYPVTFSIDATSGGIAQLSGFTIFHLVGNVEGSDFEGYCEIKFCIQFTTNNQNVNLMVQATPIQT